MLTSTRLQAATYLLGVCLFSISFLVFLNASISFVVTDLLAIDHGVGDYVGTLGFADELVALVACPVWGVLSDRIGLRTVCVIGYTIVGVSLFLFVQATNVYPQLLLLRLFFSLGAAATSTMVTAILPALTAPDSVGSIISDSNARNEPAERVHGHSTSPSLSSELTVTPGRYGNPSQDQAANRSSVSPAEQYSKSPARLAGIVGTFTGCGALLALIIFLPLPSWFSQTRDTTTKQALQSSFYVIGAVALAVAVFCFVGLRKLRGEEGKGVKALFADGTKSSKKAANGSHAAYGSNFESYWSSLKGAAALGLTEKDIGLSYLGGFVARASSVGITLFIPLFVNTYFISSGLCNNDTSLGAPGMRMECRRAYILSSKLTGISQLVALLTAPIMGYLSGRYPRYNTPLLSAAALGIIGHVSFGLLPNPETSSADGGSPAIYFIVILIGINQIGAIVCSLGLLGTGVSAGYRASKEATVQNGRRRDSDATERPGSTYQERTPTRNAEHEPLLENGTSSSTLSANTQRYAHLKGSIAGIYSFSGGAGILILTKLGGFLFDKNSPGAPFFILAIFNAILLVVGLGVSISSAFKRTGGSSGVET